MGVKNLWDILESCKKTLPLYHLQNKRVCIDLSCWMVQLQNVNKSHASIKDKLYLKGLFHRLRALIALNCSLIFVTDGSIPAIKLATYRRRLNSGTEVTRDETNSHNVPSLRRNMGSEFSCMIKEAKVLGLALGIPCLDGIEEAEAQCALLNSESLCDGCFTSDSDVFLFGARTVYRDICLGEGGYVVCYEMADIESTLGFGRNSLITLALLLGSDYSQGVHGFGPESACQIVKSVGEEVVLKKIALEGISFAKKSKGSRKQGQVLKCNDKENCSDHEMNINGSEHSSQREFLRVIDAYLKPKCHSADSDAVHRALALLPFQRTEAQKICAQLFEWPPEKTDEYILPKIAERDLRRFANLHSTSSNLGIHFPLHEIPVKCPISGIIKHRKVQGRECFEVSWEEFDGLKSSIIPAELVKSACPEKIVEFEGRKPQEKKQNHRKPRPKKSNNRTPLAEIDKQLQNLLLDIESGGNSFQMFHFLQA
ncbi:Flap endonuclease GEN-like 2 [Vitis vinifera]|uniref:Single-strand DNA endonuclease 1 n=1 Tax=Vitis vinifera TaxID=29760 RepID=A0A438CV36_VITVI|nr:Flap endonuclease GEN-like 2 [Vitis vinifera]